MGYSQQHRLLKTLLKDVSQMNSADKFYYYLFY